MDGNKPKAVLMGPFVGELYWEFGRFFPMLPYMRKNKYPKDDVNYIVFTREERFDIYGRYANIFVPLRIPGDYDSRLPNCFSLNNFSWDEYQVLIKDFYNNYKDRYNILEHIYPDIRKGKYDNKNQFTRDKMIFSYKPRLKNDELVDAFLPKDGKKLVVLAPRFRKGFQRNWPYWKEFYDLLYNDKTLFNKYNFILCGKPGEYIPDDKNRFLDMNQIKLVEGASLVGLLMSIINKCYFVFGSQSSIPNIALVYKKEVLEFGCQKHFHARLYNIFNSKITFIENRKYDWKPELALKQLSELI